MVDVRPNEDFMVNVSFGHLLDKMDRQVGQTDDHWLAIDIVENLYFEEVALEDVLEVLRTSKVDLVVVQVDYDFRIAGIIDDKVVDWINEGLKVV